MKCKQKECRNDSLKFKSIPESYCKLFIDCVPEAKHYFALSNTNFFEININSLKKAIDDKKKWLETLELGNHVWSLYHVACQRNIVNQPGINSILSLIREKVHSLETQYH